MQVIPVFAWTVLEFHSTKQLPGIINFTASLRILAASSGDLFEWTWIQSFLTFVGSGWNVLCDPGTTVNPADSSETGKKL